MDSMSKRVLSFAFIADPQIGMNRPSGLRGPGSDEEHDDTPTPYRRSKRPNSGKKLYGENHLCAECLKHRFDN